MLFCVLFLLYEIKVNMSLNSKVVRFVRKSASVSNSFFGTVKGKAKGDKKKKTRVLEKHPHDTWVSVIAEFSTVTRIVLCENGTYFNYLSSPSSYFVEHHSRFLTYPHLNIILHFLTIFIFLLNNTNFPHLCPNCELLWKY